MLKNFSYEKPLASPAPKEEKEQKKGSILDDPVRQALLARKLENVYVNRPELSNFIGVMADTKFASDYSAEQVRADEAYVEEKRSGIDETNSSSGRERLDNLEGGFALSEIGQSIITDRINKDWFPQFEAIMTADYDDLKNGVDMVMKHEKGGYLGAAFDFTVTNKEKNIYKKLQNNWDHHVLKGKLPTVKYFQDPDTGNMGPLLVPKFIIGATKKDVEELAEAYLDNNEDGLINHPLKYLILEQIETQLVAILNFHERQKGENRFNFAHENYLRIERMVEELKREIGSREKRRDLDYHEYERGSVALKVMKDFAVGSEYK